MAKLEPAMNDNMKLYTEYSWCLQNRLIFLAGICVSFILVLSQF